MRNITKIASACVTLGFCGMAGADIKTFEPSSGSWHTPEDWAPDGVPTASDRAVIPSGKTCNIDSANAIADTIVVASTGVLNINPGRTLTLENNNNNIDSAPDDHEINGEVRLLQDTGTPPTAGGTLAFTSLDHRVDGDGKIEGHSETLCKITSAAGSKVINRLDASLQGVRGSLTVEGLTGATNGKFRNEGLVEVAGDGIVLASTTILEDTSGALWSIRACKGRMTFNRESLGLNGNFFHTYNLHGQFVFNESVKTCGTYTRNCGGIVIASGRTFKFVSFVDGSGSCGNPGSAGGADPPTCNDPFVVSASVSGSTCQ